MTRPSVDFPQPDSPTTPIVLPFSIEKETSSTACSIPRGVSKYFFRFFTSINAVISSLLIGNSSAAAEMSRFDLSQAIFFHFCTALSHSGQRGLKWQPAGRLEGSGGKPEIGLSLSSSSYRWGTALNKPNVYGCVG